MMLFRQVIAALALAALAGAFAPPARTARLGGRSGIAAKKDAEPEGEDKRGISGQGLFELMSMGAGLPALGKVSEPSPLTYNAILNPSEVALAKQP
mmetsp:Transcript_21126/g.64353  ORF Transcript_21126/g.64353 Transcript_21126/m.64353 type:complete len:96 (-) Transcript_21126:896-1183(-)